MQVVRKTLNMLKVHIIVLYRAIYLSKNLHYIERKKAESQPLTVLSSTHLSLMPHLGTSFAFSMSSEKVRNDWITIYYYCQLGWR